MAGRMTANDQHRQRRPPEARSALLVAGAIVALVAIAAVVVPTPTPAPTATPTPAPTATPTPAPTATPTPAPTATPTPTSTPTPSGSTVPSSINATCSSDVSAALNAWIAAQPSGSTLVFPSGSCYLFSGDSGINLTGRSNLTLVGTGSTLHMYTTGASNLSSSFFFQNSSHITIRGFTVDGGNTASGTTAAVSTINERRNAAAIRSGSSYIEFDHVTWLRVVGFGPFLSTDGGSTWPSYISIHDSTIQGAEMGIGVVAGRHLSFVHNTINDSVYSAIDFEPDASAAGPNGEAGYGGGFQDALVSDNDITRYSWGQTLTSWFISACPQDPVVATAVMDGLTVTGNRVWVGPATADNGNADGLGGLGVRSDKANLKNDFVFTNNWTADNDTRSSSRSVMSLANVHNLTVTGNTQPISNGSAFVSDSGTSGARNVSGNALTP
jgi:hypothetical protein